MDGPSHEIVARWLPAKRLGPSCCPHPDTGWGQPQQLFRPPLSAGLPLGALAFWGRDARALAVCAGRSVLPARLLCNLFDGLVAVRGRSRRARWAFWNEAPDRLADILFFTGAGSLWAICRWALPVPAVRC